MMPVSLLVALLLAFGNEPSGGEIPHAAVRFRILETAGGIVLIALCSLGLGRWVAARVSRFGYPTLRIRRRYALGARLLSVLALATYGWIIHSVGWSRLVLSNWGLRDSFLVDDIAVLSPYLLIQLAVWWGLFFAEQALRVRGEAGRGARLSSYLILKSRQSVGLILPLILIFVVRQDVLARFWPEWSDNALVEPLEMVVMGGVILLISPLFVRLAWPTRSLPEGPLRTRLERVARRVGFRFTDVLIWDTGHTMVNACVTGVLPRFRYVLLTDALIEALSPDEVSAVFGHEVGHVAHRHLPYFGFFFLGSLGVLSLIAEAVSGLETWIIRLPWVPPEHAGLAGEIVEAVAVLAPLGLFFWLVFGQLSRRFERQADIFGCKVVSCGYRDCPPHLDLEDDLAGHADTQGHELCPVGIQIFSDALTSVARQNGIDLSARSWRHGSIANRLAFLEQLRFNPEREPRFQRGLHRFRLGLMLVLFTALLAAVFTHS